MKRMMRVRKRFALIICGLILAVFIFLYFLINNSIPAAKESGFQSIENKLKELELGLNKHKYEVREIKKQINTIERNEKQTWKKDVSGNGASADIKPEAIQVPRKAETNIRIKNEPKETSKCSFRPDIDPKPDIQMLDVYDKLNFDNQDGGVWKQGWRVEYDPYEWNSHHKLKVFLVPHSHNDPGWVKTFDQYFEQQTKAILSNMLVQLIQNPSMTFIWAEISYFSKWFEPLSDTQKQDVKSLLKRGQLEFVTGGWVMTDEANSHWFSMVQQLTEGQVWLRKHLNVTPRAGFAIDPFGESASMALILKEAGFENMLIHRTHYEVKKRLAKTKELEFRWRQLWDTNGDTEIFTHMMPFYSYDVPHTCGPDPKVCCQFDFKRLPGYGLNCPWRIPPTPITEMNVARKAELILDQWRKKSVLYKTRSVFIPLGDDFRYTQTSEWEAQRTNYEKLFEYMNNEPNLNVEAKFGTLQEYFDSVHEEKKLSDFPSLSGDFFTYADRDDHYWSGYFTSRPFHKRLDRILLTYLRSAEMLHAWSTWDAEASFDDLLQKGRRALSLFQHHDGIAGTARDYVMKDYLSQMLEALSSCKFVIQQSVYRYLTKPSIYNPDFKFTYFNIDDSRSYGVNDNRPTIILGDDVPTKYIVLHNSLPQEREEVVEFYVSKPFVMVESLDGKAIASQVAPVWSWHKVFNGVGPQASTTKYRILFKAKVSPMGLTTYVIRSTHSMETSLKTTFSKITILTQTPFSVSLQDYPLQAEFVEPRDISLRIAGNRLGASFSSTGMLKSVSLDETEHVPIHLEFLKYGARRGVERSGAYLFLPDGIATPLKQLTTNTILLTKGPLESSVATGLPFAIHETIMRDGESSLEIRNIVDIGDMLNTEIVMRMSTGIDSQDTFYTDLNGMQFIKRRRFTKLPLQANYYPIPAGIYIEDERLRLTLLTGQPLGGSSLQSGEIEVMQDRRLEQDDNLGLGQGVQDNQATLNIFKLALEKVSSCKKRSKDYPAGFLTPATHFEYNRLLLPMEKLVWHENDWVGVMPSYGSEREALDNGIDVAVIRNLKNVKSIQKSGGSSGSKGSQSTIGLVLNRKYLEECGTVDKPMTDFINIHRALGIAENVSIFNSHLTLLERKSPTPKEVNICPTEIKSFIINR